MELENVKDCVQAPHSTMSEDLALWNSCHRWYTFNHTMSSLFALKTNAELIPTAGVTSVYPSPASALPSSFCPVTLSGDQSSLLRCYRGRVCLFCVVIRLWVDIQVRDGQPLNNKRTSCVIKGQCFLLASPISCCRKLRQSKISKTLLLYLNLL